MSERAFLHTIFLTFLFAKKKKKEKGAGVSQQSCYEIRSDYVSEKSC